MPLTTVERYLAKVDVRGSDECWPWTAATDRDGYGIFWGGERYPHNNAPIMVKATRWGWKHHRGTDPGKLLVRHTCDNPPCQNPAHWLLGTNADNMRDMRERGRGHGPGFGEANHQTVLTDAQVRIIRASYIPYVVSQQALADEFHVSREHIRDIVSGKKRSSVI
jgi:hypothetical protein